MSTRLRTAPRFLLASAALMALLHGQPALALPSLPAENPKYARIKGVYDSVARAFGDGRVPPRLIVTPAGSKNGNVVAWSDPGTEGAIGMEGDGAPLQEGFIAIEERVFDRLSSLNGELDDALAFLLGHELTHYYMRHGWVGDFGNSFASLDMGRRMIKAASYEDTIKRETEADYFGGFYGYLAGYDTMGIAPRALDLIYTEYRLPDRLPNYPSRAERKAIAERAEGNLKKMVPVFDAASQLLLLERYQEGARLFEQLAHNFPSREMFNNAGVAYALEALRLSRPSKVPFVYPFELDAETRLKGKGLKSKGIPNESAARRTQLLNLAAENFEKAMQRDKGYGAACANLAAVTTLLGDHDSAVVLANKAIELAKKGNETLTVGNALVVRGIAYAGAGNRERGLVDFAAARNLNLSAAAINLGLLQGDSPLKTQQGTEIVSDAVESIGGTGSRDSFVKGSDTVTFSLKGVASAEPTITVHARTSGKSEDALVAVGHNLTRVVSARKGYDGRTARGIAIGSSAAEVKDRYGVPSRVMISRQGTYYLYRKGEILFALDEGERVTGWSIFATR